MTHRNIKKINDLAVIALGVVALAATILGAAAVFARYVLSASVTASDEIVTYLIVWGMLISFGVAELSNQHLRATILLDKMSAAHQGRLLLFSRILGILFAAALVYFGVEVAWQRYLFNEVSPTLLQFPQWVSRAAVPVGFLFVLAGLLLNLADRRQAGGDRD
ncbi:TRAP transporter small permease [Alcaligenaceae bacterium]|nr:TRAP transporter small permease [Alcaligenaceae bacterium]